MFRFLALLQFTTHDLTGQRTSLDLYSLGAKSTLSRDESFPNLAKGSYVVATCPVREKWLVQCGKEGLNGCIIDLSPPLNYYNCLMGTGTNHAFGLRLPEKQSVPGIKVRGQALQK